jgi:hypothetical protein
MGSDDGVVDIDHGRAVDPGQQRGGIMQADQQPGRDRVELADMTEAKLPQKRPQRRGGIRAGEDGAHRPVAQQGHVDDAVHAGDHAGHHGADLRPSMSALVGGHAEVATSQLSQATSLGQHGHRHQSGARHQIRIIEQR